ncbi:MAG TPA: DUF2845 domain-containing protein [Smithellaceae bacterium]|nr:DUF2845 domain-containing protein [Smithellaceae bacterium]
MKKTMSLLFISSILIYTIISADEVRAFRCGSEMVTTGDTKAQVLAACGKPAFRETVCENNQEYTAQRDKTGRIKTKKKCVRKKEVWRYNCGEGDFIYALTFAKDKLIKEETAGRGSGKSGCLGK